MKKFILTVLGLLIMIVSCKTSNNADVEKTINHFFEGMYDRDFNKARENATPESEEVISLLESLANASPPAADEVKPKIMIDEIKIENDSVATALVKAQDQPNEVKISLKKRSGNWKVAFDMQSLAVMLGQNPETVDEDMMAPPVNDSLDINLQKSTVPDSIL